MNGEDGLTQGTEAFGYGLHANRRLAADFHFLTLCFSSPFFICPYHRNRLLQLSLLKCDNPPLCNAL